MVTWENGTISVSHRQGLEWIYRTLSLPLERLAIGGLGRGIVTDFSCVSKEESTSFLQRVTNPQSCRWSLINSVGLQRKSHACRKKTCMEEERKKDRGETKWYDHQSAHYIWNCQKKNLSRQSLFLKNVLVLVLFLSWKSYVQSEPQECGFSHIQLS